MGGDLPLDYYDRILIAIAASLGGGVIAGVTTVVGFQAGLLAGAIVATVFVYDAMFRNPPRPVPSPRAKATAIVWHAFLAVLVVLTCL